jgi:hypothetical protein
MQTRPVPPCDRGPLVHGLVGVRVNQHGTLPRQNGYHRGVDEGDGREHQAVGRPQEVRQLLFDVHVETGTPEEPGPARVGPPTRQLGGHRVDDGRMEVESQVVTRREVAEPLLPDTNPTARHLVDDGIHHRMRGAEPFEVLPPRVATPRLCLHRGIRPIAVQRAQDGC